MFVKQISVFLENKGGRLANVTKILNDNGVNIRALSIADTTDFGILRLIVNNPEKAQSALKNEGIIVRTTDVLAISIKDVAGSLSSALKTIDDCGISIEYMYAYLGNIKGEATVILKVDNPKVATQKLIDTCINVLDTEKVYNI